MSSSFLVVIPLDPSAEIPTTAPRVKDLLSEMADTDEARIKDYGKLQFIDCGDAFEHVACPSCKTHLSVAQWHTLMDQDWHDEDGFHLNEHTMPCCAALHTLDALSYIAPQGFSKWFISARAFGRGSLTATELKQLEGAAGISLRTIIQQY